MKSSTIQLPTEVVQQIIQFLYRVAPVPSDERNQLIHLVEYLEAQLEKVAADVH